MNFEFLPPELVALLGAGFWHAAIVFLRLAAMVAALPAISEEFVPTNVKLVVAIVFTLIVAPSVPTQATPNSLFLYGGLAISEAIIGLALGFGVRIFVLTLQTAGSIAAQSTSLSQAFGGIGAEPMPAIGSFLVFAGTAFAVMMGLHVKVAEFMIQSYQLFPVGQFPPASELTPWIVTRVSHSFSMSFALAAPFVITSVIYNFTLGFISRAMPQLMVSIIGAPVITFGGMFILMVASPMILMYWAEVFFGFFADPTGGAR
ncbi:flagellar biosynthetic protein FliR [Epibacterium ulvae]|uniref:flagellar biosynthetic protein FliR n=1 Tax=Epibacterium ulvae TaxID=1156985 RepID=UPI001BFC1FF1|nr:flagellar biosynthetic protein FliR [Epibacterium ulvae]MBT8155501.1 flagellar biosynthetic protein FliR [Epibacterium ulvae]